MDKFIYLLSDPETGFVRWVGATSNPRLRYNSHLVEKSTPEKDEWVSSLRSKGLKPVMEVLSEEPIEEWKEEEVFLIMYLRFLGSNLLNRDPGGHGAGAERTPAMREKVRRTMTGRKASPEAITNMSRAQKGKMISPEARANMSRALKGLKRSPEARANIGRGGIGRKHSAESLARRVATRKANKLAKAAAAAAALLTSN